MKKHIFVLLLAVLIIIPSFNFAQSQDTLFVAFWNQENLFDTIDDPHKNDKEFLPDGSKEWTEERLDTKLYHHARVIRSMNNSNGPRSEEHTSELQSH